MRHVTRMPAVHGCPSHRKNHNLELLDNQLMRYEQGGGGFTAYNFFQNIIGMLLIVVFTLGYKVIMRTKWQSAKTADLQTGRNELRQDEIEFLDQYYSRPWWKRLGTYLSLY